MRCPLCETENRDDSAECGTCGRHFHADADLVDEVSLIEGLEETVRDPLESAAAPVALMPELERTQLARRDLRVQEETVPDVERTPIAFDPEVASLWSGASGVEIDLGREQDTDERTPAPQDTGTCPWCGAPADGAVCDACGRRRLKYTEAPVAKEELQSAETVLCPACFSRVAVGPRCGECGVPFAPREL